MRTLHGKRAVITGAASGIGKAIALELARSGCHTCLIDIDRVTLDRAVDDVRRLGVEAIGLPCDVASRDEVERALNRMLGRWPEIDILVNNAGIAYRGRAAEMPRADWQHVLAVNLHAPIQICQHLLPVLLSRPDAHVLNVCSVLGLYGPAKFAAYSTSKFGLVGYSESLRSEYLGSQIGVSAVCPGFVRTPFIESVAGPGGVHAKRSIPRWLCTTSEVVARKSVAAIRRNRGLVLVTPLAHIIWRLKRFVPGLLEVPGRLRTRRIASPAERVTTGASGSDPRAGGAVGAADDPNARRPAA